MTSNVPGSPGDSVPGAVPPPHFPGAVPPPPAPGYSAAPPPPAPGFGPAQPGYGQQGYGQQGYGQQGYPAPAYASAPPLSESDQRLWAVLSHVGSLLFPVLAPLIIWLMLRGRGAFVDDQAKESLNFQIAVTIAAAVLGVVSVITLGIGAVLYLPLGIAFLVFVIIASVRSSQGIRYRYPLTLRLIR